jgi:putative Ca2+/H+ antiporter (TMEM165/GDT1 family)
VATLANHFLAGWLGAWLAGLVSPATLRLVIAASFVAFGLWVGEALARRIDMRLMRWAAAALFVLLGLLTLFAGELGVPPSGP